MNDIEELYYDQRKVKKMMLINLIKITENLLIKNISEINFADILALLPEIYLVLMSLLALMIIGYANFKPGSTKIEKKMTIMPTLYNFSVNSLGYTIILYILQLSEFDIYKNPTMISFATYTVSDVYTIVMKIAVLATIMVIMYASKDSFRNHPRHLIEYPVIILFMSIFLLVLISSYNFITLFLAILGFSLTLYVLLLNDSFNHAAREAGIKYFYLSTVSTGLLICGIFLMYLIFNSTSFMTIAWLIHNWKECQTLESNGFLLTVMLYLIIFGFLFKLAAFPCHLWAPEVYDGSPNAVTVLFVLPIKIATFAIFLRVLGHTFADLYQYWHYIVWLSAMFSMIWGCLGALTEQTIKRFMAYSSINQMGFLLMGIACGTYEGFRAALIYLLLYVLMNLGFFIIFLCTKEKTTNKSLTYLTDFNNFAKNNYILSIGVVVILFSMAGIPPLGGFFGKYFIFLHSFETGHLGLVLVGMITSVIGAYYYLRIIKIMWFEKGIDNKFKFEGKLPQGLYEIYVATEYTLIAFLLLTPWVFTVTSIVTTSAINPICVWLVK